jgi:hypothetical protein
VRTLHRQATGFCAPAHLAKNIADRDRAHLRAGHARDFEHRQAAGRLRLDLDLLVVELARAQFLAKGFPGRRARAGTDQRVEHALLGGELGARMHVLALAFAYLRDRDLDEIADDLLDIAPDIADLGEFGGLDLDERRAGKLCQPPRDLGLADAGRTDHQDVLRRDLFADGVGKALAAIAIAHRHGDRTLRLALTDDVPVELGNDATGGEFLRIRHSAKTSTLSFV